MHKCIARNIERLYYLPGFSRISNYSIHSGYFKTLLRDYSWMPKTIAKAIDKLQLNDTPMIANLLAILNTKMRFCYVFQIVTQYELMENAPQGTTDMKHMITKAQTGYYLEKYMLAWDNINKLWISPLSPQYPHYEHVVPGRTLTLDEKTAIHAGDLRKNIATLQSLTKAIYEHKLPDDEAPQPKTFTQTDIKITTEHELSRAMERLYHYTISEYRYQNFLTSITADSVEEYFDDMFTTTWSGLGLDTSVFTVRTRFA